MTTIRLSTIRAQARPMTGVCLDGPTFINKGSSQTYTITDYDVFSFYKAEVSVGTVEVIDDKVTVSIPDDADEQQINLVVYINEVSRTFVIALSSNPYITKPAITSPINNSIDNNTNITFQFSNFVSVPVGSLIQSGLEIEVATDQYFTDIVKSEIITSGDFTRYITNLNPGRVYFARVKYYSGIVKSGWSSVISFSTATSLINKPQIFLTGGAVNDVKSSPNFYTSEFTTNPPGSDTHVSTSWLIRETDTNAIVYELNNSTSNKTDLKADISLFKTSTNYSAQAKFNGQVSQSMFSDKLMFRTAYSFVPEENGAPYQGGYYVGKIVIGGKTYALVASPKSKGETTAAWSSNYTNISGAISLDDGWSNTLAMIAAGNCPAATYCRGLIIDGYDDWYLPSVNELEMCYRVFKPGTSGNQTGGYGPYSQNGYNPSSLPIGGPYTSGSPTQTNSAIFRSGGSEAFIENWYWSSTQYNSSAAWLQYFVNGRQRYDAKDLTTYVRAVRKVLID